MHLINPCPRLHQMGYASFFFLCILFNVFPAFAQDLDNASVSEDWFLQDPDDDHLQGMSVDKAYRELLQGYPSHTVTVAVIDSGVDTEHEDLQGSIWVNEDEIQGNGIDDDGNGYVDDVHGWNFIGGKEGNVNQDTDELTREYKRLKAKFTNVDTTKMRGKKKKEYEKYREIKTRFEGLLDINTRDFETYNQIYERTVQNIAMLKELLGVEQLTFDKIEAIASDDPQLLALKRYLLMFNFKEIAGEEGSLDALVFMLKKQADHFRQTIQYGYNESFDPRPIVGDRYDDPYEKKYGNNDVKGFGAYHGTHVAGIIGANRQNAIGVRGVVENVKIMPIRAVPNGGDERDKDVANAIIYAVDNGAQVINMSFGKSLSPRKKAVDRAVRYAEKKGVLLVHAAGNAGKNTDVKINFPNRYYGRKNKKINAWLEVGASSSRNDKNFIASFSNYGKKEVDVFAPGIQIKSTVPDNNYSYEQGTSMAAPMVTGVAALLLSYFPQLSAVQIKDIIRRSVRQYKGLKVLKPGTKEEEKVELAEISSTGGVVNAYEATKLALAWSKNIDR